MNYLYKPLCSLFVLLVWSIIGNAQTRWTNIGPGGGSDLHFLEVHPDNADIIYAGGDIEGIFKTSDRGTSWTNINDNLAQSLYGGDVYWINDIVLAPDDYQTVYIATGVGLFRSTTGGGNWELLYPEVIDNEDAQRMIGSVAIDSNNSQHIFIGLGNSADGSWGDFEPWPNDADYSGVYRSTNGGSSWEALTFPMTDGASVHSIVMNPNNSDQVILASTDGIYQSNNGGDAWSASNTGLPHTNAHQMIGRYYHGQFALYLSMKTVGDVSDSTTFAGGLFRSTDFGATWTDMTGNLPQYDRYDHLFYDYWKFDVNPLNPDVVVIGPTRGSGYEDPAIYITRNSGGEWEYLHTPFSMGGWIESDWFWDPYIFDIKYAPSDTNQLVSCTDQVDMSHDGGQTWSESYATAVGDAWHGHGLELMNTETVAFDPNNSDVMYVGYDDMGLFRSDDHSDSFHRLDPHQDPDIGSLSDVDAVKDICVDHDNGDLYISRFQGSQGGYDAGYSSGGITLSNDRGATQTDITGDLPHGRSDLILDQISGSPGDRTLYAAIYLHGVYKTTDSGSNWTGINTGLSSGAAQVWVIAIDPNDADMLYLGLNRWGAGEQSLYKSTDGGLQWNLVTNFPSGDVLMIYVDRFSTVYASYADNFEWNYSGALARSSDGGNSWEEILDHPRVIDVQLHPQYDNVLLATGQQWYKYDNTGMGGAIYLSTNNGASWDKISGGVAHTFFNFARFDPSNPQQIYAGTAGGGLWKGKNVPTATGDETTIPNRFAVEQNYPNPFNPATTLDYTLPDRSQVQITLYNIRGEKVSTLINRFQNAGHHSVRMNLADYPTGIYLVRFKTPEYQTSVKITLLK